MAFKTALVTKHTHRHSWGRRYNKLKQSLVYETTDGLEIVVPEGFETDFASVPRIMFMIFGVLLLAYVGFFPSAMAARVVLAVIGIALALFPAYGFHAEAAVVHDYLYRTKFNKWHADLIFLEAMRSCGVFLLVRLAMFAAVWVFGWIGYAINYYTTK